MSVILRIARTNKKYAREKHLLEHGSLEARNMWHLRTKITRQKENEFSGISSMGETVHQIDSHVQWPDSGAGGALHSLLSAFAKAVFFTRIKFRVQLDFLLITEVAIPLSLLLKNIGGNGGQNSKQKTPVLSDWVRQTPPRRPLSAFQCF
jgi:hypothetical protein